MAARLLCRAILVEAAAVKASPGRKRPAGAILLTPVDEGWLRAFVADHARVEKFDVRRGETVTVNPPAVLIGSVLAAAPWSGLPELIGVIASPVVRPDGSVLECAGFDDATGLLFAPLGTDFPPVPPHPTQADALAALTRLRDLLKDFPFCAAADESVALAAILTAVQRKVLGTAPAFAFSAPKPGSGKSLLARLPALVATGRDAYLVAPKKVSAETEKELFAALLEGPSVLLIDNIEIAYPVEPSVVPRPYSLVASRACS
ncbi:MAG: hypothetical protein WAS73_19045 [Defluviicoccus sp.]